MTVDKTAVIGCGLMGSAIAKALAAGGEDVIVWNRSRDKAEQLEGASIRAAADLQEVADSANLVLVVLSTYEVARTVLDPVQDWSGTTVVNLVTGSPPEASEFESWITGRGAAYLDGAILVGPREIGSADAVILFAGDSGHWSADEPRLRLLGGASRHVSDLSSGANVLDVAATGAFYMVALSGFVEAAAYAQASGVPPKALLGPAEALIDLLRREVREAGKAIETDRHETDQATLDVFLEAAENWRGTMADAGQRAGMMKAAVESLRIAQAGGQGHLGFAAQCRTAGVSADPSTRNGTTTAG